ncbi:hypothetical protein ACFL35_13805 [Candidatus Riflebacteria bacterium]
MSAKDYLNLDSSNFYFFSIQQADGGITLKNNYELLNLFKQLDLFSKKFRTELKNYLTLKKAIVEIRKASGLKSLIGQEQTESKNKL